MTAVYHTELKVSMCWCNFYKPILASSSGKGARSTKYCMNAVVC